MRYPDLRMTYPDPTLVRYDLRIPYPDLRMRYPDLTLDAFDLRIPYPDLTVGHSESTLDNTFRTYKHKLTTCVPMLRKDNSSLITDETVGDLWKINLINGKSSLSFDKARYHTLTLPAYQNWPINQLSGFY